jgi:hypothetical protein
VSEFEFQKNGLKVISVLRSLKKNKIKELRGLSSKLHVLSGHKLSESSTLEPHTRILSCVSSAAQRILPYSST